MTTLNEWEICQTEVPRSEVLFDQPHSSLDTLLLLERENSWLTIFLQISALKKVSSFSSLLTTSLPVLRCTGSPNVVAFLNGVSMLSRLVQVDYRKRFPVYQASSVFQVAGFGRGSAYHEDLEQRPVDWERGANLHLQAEPTSWNTLESFIRFTLSFKSCI